MVPRPARHLGLCVVLLAVHGLGHAQKPESIPLVPAANWRLTGTKPLNLDALPQWGADPTIEREYGVEEVEHRKYVLGNRSAEVLLEHTSDPSTAYGLLTFYQTPSYAPARGMQLTATGPEGALMVRGRYFIRVRPAAGEPLSENDLHALLILIGGTRPSQRELASLPTPLPPRGLIPGSEKYVVGLEAARRILPSFRTDLIGFSQGAEVHLGDYRSGAHRLTLMAAAYPTPQIARARFGAMDAFLGFNQERGAESVFARRMGSYIVMVLGAPSSSSANRLMDQLHVTGDISWDEAPPRVKTFVMELVQLILAIMLLSFFIAGLGVLGGIAVFGWKRFMARWFPQVEWGNPDRESIISLNLK